MSILDELPSRVCRRPSVISDGHYYKYAFTISFQKQIDKNVESFIRQKFFPIIEYVLDIYSDKWDVRLNRLKDNPSNVTFEVLDRITSLECKYIEIKFDSKYPERIYMLLCQPVFFTMTKYIEIQMCNMTTRNYIRDDTIQNGISYKLAREGIYINTVIANMNSHLYYNENSGIMDFDTIAKFISPFCSSIEETERWMTKWLTKAARKTYQSPSIRSIY